MQQGRLIIVRLVIMTVVVVTLSGLALTVARAQAQEQAPCVDEPAFALIDEDDDGELSVAEIRAVATAASAPTLAAQAAQLEERGIASVRYTGCATGTSATITSVAVPDDPDDDASGGPLSFLNNTATLAVLGLVCVVALAGMMIVRRRQG